jgi:hypothetical protein
VEQGEAQEPQVRREDGWREDCSEP